MHELPAGAVRVLLVGEGPLIVDLASALADEHESLAVVTQPRVDDVCAVLEDGSVPDIDCLVVEYEAVAPGSETAFDTARIEHPVIAVADRQTPIDLDTVSGGLTDCIRLEQDDQTDYTLLARRLLMAVDHTRRCQQLERIEGRDQSWADEAALKSTALDEAPIGIQLTDPSRPDNPIVYANEGFQRLTGYPVREILGRNCRFLQGEDTDPESVATLREAIDAREPVSVEIQNYRRDGTMFWNQVHIAPIYDDTDTLTHFVGFQVDITERKERERKLQEQNERLEQFASVVSHDLRNPLSVAASYLEAARADSGAENEHLAAVADAHDRMEQLIEDLLVLAREGQTLDDVGPIDIQMIADRCWRNVSTEDAVLVLAVDGQIEADETRFAQLLENLFRNAVEHGATTDQEQLTVTIGALEDGFYVEDDGAGISPENREQIFEDGYTTAESGTGLGLQIIADIVAAHDWTIDVADGTDGGARFEITGVDFDGWEY